MFTKYVRKTSAAVIIGGEGVLVGMRVNTTSSGTMKIYDDASGANGTVIFNTFTPAVGYHDLGSVHCTIGAYADITNLDATFFVLAEK